MEIQSSDHLSEKEQVISHTWQTVFFTSCCCEIRGFIVIVLFLQNSWGAGWRNMAWSLPSAPILMDTTCRTCSQPLTSSVWRGRCFLLGNLKRNFSSTSPPSGRSSTSACAQTTGWWRRVRWWSGTTRSRTLGTSATAQRMMPVGASTRPNPAGWRGYCAVNC